MLFVSIVETLLTSTNNIGFGKELAHLVDHTEISNSKIAEL